jgi:hypothetical protein
MTGPEHYLKAEDHLTDAVTMDEEPEVSGWHQRQAQVHATLALAAAAAVAKLDGMPTKDAIAWQHTAGLTP